MLLDPSNRAKDTQQSPRQWRCGDTEHRISCSKHGSKLRKENRKSCSVLLGFHQSHNREDPLPNSQAQSLKSASSRSDPTSKTATLMTESCFACLPNPSNGLRDVVIPIFVIDTGRLARSLRASSCS